MKIRWDRGQFTFWPENDQEKAILSHAWREMKHHIAEQQDAEPQKPMAYWGDATDPDGKESGTFKLTNWDRRDYFWHESDLRTGEVTSSEESPTTKEHESG